jgi:hypothetical protein
MAWVAIGLKAHSGWAAGVALRERGSGLEIALRQRLELVAPEDAGWAKAPYHAAEHRPAAEAEPLVARAIAAAHRHAEQALAGLLADCRAQGDEVVGCGVLTGAGMPDWTLAEILAVHFRMHKAEGELFRGVLLRAAERLGLPCIGVREKQLEALAAEAISLGDVERRSRLAEAGRRAGPPWARDQKVAALAAWIALRSTRRG